MSINSAAVGVEKQRLINLIESQGSSDGSRAKFDVPIIMMSGQNSE